MQRLCETNMEQTAGYGNDPHCEHAAELSENFATPLPPECISLSEGHKPTKQSSPLRSAPIRA